MPEDLPAAGAVDLGGVDDLAGKSGEHGGNQIGAEGALKDAEDDDDGELRVIETDRLGNVVDRVDERFLGHHDAHDEGGQDDVPAADPADGEGVGVEQADGHAEDRDGTADQDAVEELLAEI